MNQDFSSFTTRLREFIVRTGRIKTRASFNFVPEFNELALSLFELQFAHNRTYRQFCEHRGVTPADISHWAQIPALPSAAFKDFEVSCLAAHQRTTVFVSSGTMRGTSSRHFHSPTSLSVYDLSILTWFQANFDGKDANDRQKWLLLFLTPNPNAAPHSSLVHMFASIQNNAGTQDSGFLGQVDPSGAWSIDFETLNRCRPQFAQAPVALLGTAFNFVHLLDYLQEHKLELRLPAGSWIMETGGYKGRSRELSKRELHGLLNARLGVASTRIISEYGMCELSSQAYDQSFHSPPAGSERGLFVFPPWTRFEVISPETGQVVDNGQIGLLRIFDLANVYSVMAIQTEDLVVQHGPGFELLGRAASAPLRGCSLMSVT